MTTDGRVKYSVTLSIAGKGNYQINPEVIRELYFVENIHNFCITGKIVFDDFYGIMDQAAFVGHEQISISWGDDAKIAFEIYKVDKIEQLNPTQTTSENRISLTLVDLTFAYWTRRRFSKSWGTEESPMNTGSIVIQIMRDFINNPKLGTFEYPTGDSLIHFCMPYWTPKQAVLWLGARSKGGGSGQGGYLLFNSMKEDGSVVVNWCTLSHLVNSGPTDSIPYNIERNETKKDDVHYMRNIILDWDIIGLDRTGFNRLCGSKQLGFDHSEKKLIIEEYKYKDTAPQIEKLGKKGLHKDISDERVWYNLTGDPLPTTRHENINFGTFAKMYSKQQTFHAVVEGTQDPYRTLGMKIDIKWPQRENSESNALGQMYKGEWMIKGITHMFVNQDDYIYRQKLSLTKLGYEDPTHGGLI